MVINSDPVSEMYRKYVIELIVEKNIKYFLLWGTDIGNKENDYLLVDNVGKIVVFSKIKELINFTIESNDSMIDSLNTKKWALNYNSFKPYTTYDLFNIKNKLKNGSSLDKINTKEATDLLNFYNIFSDYAHQVNNDQFLNMISKKHIKCFFEYIYDNVFWKAKATKTEELNISSFAKEYLKIVTCFENSLTPL